MRVSAVDVSTSGFYENCSESASGNLEVCLEDSVLASGMLTCSLDKMKLNYPSPRKTGSIQLVANGLFYN